MYLNCIQVYFCDSAILFIFIVIIIINLHFKRLFFMLAWIKRVLNGFRDVKSLSTTWYQVFRGLRFICCPFNNYIPAYLHHAIIIVSLHGNLSLLMQFLMLSRPKRSLSSEEGFLSSKVTYTSILWFSYHCAPTSICQLLQLPKFLNIKTSVFLFDTQMLECCAKSRKYFILNENFTVYNFICCGLILILVLVLVFSNQYIFSKQPSG